MYKTLEIFRFEFKRAILQPAIYIYWAILALLSFFIVNAAGGAFKEVNVNIASENVFVNSPAMIEMVLGLFGYLGIFIVAAISANIVFKDFQYQSLELMFSTPLSKFSYIFGRFLAAFALNLLVFTGAVIGFYSATLMPYLTQDLFGPNSLAIYLIPYLTRVVPNLFIVTALFFTISLLLRSTVMNWVSVLLLYILYGVGMNLFADLDSKYLAAILDPFGMLAASLVNESVSAHEMNDRITPLEGAFLVNRLCWTVFASALMFFTYLRFRFSFEIRTAKKTPRVMIQENLEKVEISLKRFSFPKFTILEDNFKVCRFLTGFEIKKLFKNTYFRLIILVSIVFLAIISQSLGKIYDTETYPVTYQVLDILGGGMELFLFIIILLFSGEMIWSDRDVKIHEIKFSYPNARWTSLISKFIALSLGIVFMLSLIMVVGITAQALTSYYHFEIGLYLKSLFGIRFINYLLLIVMAFFIHSLVNNKYMGYVVLILYWVWENFFAYRVLDHHLLVYGGGTSVFYSDMNKYGFSLYPYFVFKMYWSMFAIILMMITNQLTVVQTEDHWKQRFSLFVFRTKDWVAKGIAFVLLIALSIGAYIFYNTNIKNEYYTAYDQELLRVKYETNYKHFEYKAQPKITDIKLKADIYPESGDFKASGDYSLRNTTSEKIDTILIDQNKFITNLTFDGEADLVDYDQELDLAVYHLKKDLLPGESLNLHFVFEAINNGFDFGGANNVSQKNGTFLYNSLFPAIGYRSKSELSAKKVRAKHGLEKKEIARKRNDKYGIDHNFITPDADFINFEAVVSTSGNQTALTPGKLVKDWTENGRNYFHYKSEHPMIHYYAILSGEYICEKEMWQPKDSLSNPVEISILHHAGHDFNIENMIKGVKLSLDNYSQIYTPYQFEQLRIVEFPRSGSYAQSFPNIIPFSEGIGFIADLRDLDDESLSFEDQKIDYPFYITAHEMAHQWWAHQLIAADVEGSQMLMESITQYSAIKTMEKYYGAEKMSKFLENELFGYVSKRKNENYAERPLELVAQNQSSIYYNKGSIVMYGLDNYLGSERLQATLKSFLKENAFKGAPYPTTTEFIDKLKEQTPDSLLYYVEDALTKNTFYKIKLDSVNYVRNKDLTYTVNAAIQCDKFYADGFGKETEAPCNDYVEIQIDNKKGKTLFSEKLRLESGLNYLSIDLKRKPNEMLIDPKFSLITKKYKRKAVEIPKQAKVVSDDKDAKLEQV